MGDLCSTDFVRIPGGRGGSRIATYDKYCGADGIVYTDKRNAGTAIVKNSTVQSKYQGFGNTFYKSIATMMLIAFLFYRLPTSVCPGCEDGRGGELGIGQREGWLRPNLDSIHHVHDLTTEWWQTV